MSYLFAPSSQAKDKVVYMKRAWTSTLHIGDFPLTVF